MASEIWKPLPNRSPYYVSNLGNVKKCDKIKKLSIDSNGYLRTTINGKSNYVHRLVAKVFCNKDDDTKILVDHIDRNKTNNKAINLRWVTAKENSNNKSKDYEINGKRLNLANHFIRQQINSIETMEEVEKMEELLTEEYEVLEEHWNLLSATKNYLIYLKNLTVDDI